ncbi:MAG TPA: hypothetical protein VM936_18430 [Pyrinomonadaceae bacterium]|jgi:hypothetical protein|nr:hypothetical protein [Pyrinomonadaceae bacterium]
MSTVNPSDGDGVRVTNYDDNRVGETQGNGTEQAAVADGAQVQADTDAQAQRLSLLQFTADYRRFSLDDMLARRGQPTLFAANTQQAAPVQTGLPREDLEARARRIFDRFQNDGFLNSGTPYADIAAELNGISAQDALRLREIYQQKYSPQRGGRDLLNDVALEIRELQDRVRAFRILAPERVHHQDVPLAEREHFAGIIADPPLGELISGASVKYTFNEGDYIRAPNSEPFVRYLVQGPDGVETRTGYTFDGQYEKPGVYRVTFEVINRGQPPQYYTLRQVVRDPAEKAREVLLNMPGTTIDPELFLLGIDSQIQVAEQNLSQLQTRVGELRARDYSPQHEISRLDSQIRNLEDALSQLRQIKQEAPGKIFGGATGPVIPLQAALVPVESQRPIPLQLYAKPLGNNRWAIVDMTSPANARVYEGQAGATSEDGLRGAWREFVSANNLPAGQVAALPPAGMNFGAQEVWNDKSAGRSGFQQWASNLGWGSLALAALGVVAAIVPGLEPLAPPLFIAAGATGAASGGLNIYDRVRYGNFQWNSAETALDMLSIVGGVAGAGGGTAAILRNGGTAVIRTAEGASLTLRNLGKFTSISQGVDVGAGVASGVIISNVWLERIQRINDSGLPPAEKERQVNALLQQAAMMGGIIVIGRGVSRFTAVAATELDDLLRVARFDPELEQLVRTTPGLQRALQEQGAEKLRTLFDDYRAGGVNGTGLNVRSFREYVSARGVPTRTENVPQSLTEALGVSTEGLRRMSVRELNEAVLSRTSPNLLAAFRRGDLPAGVRTALDEVLSQDFKLATATNFDNARSTMSKTLNQRLGASANSVAELRQILGYFGGSNQGGTRGSIGNAFYRTHLAAGEQAAEVTIPRRLFTTRVDPNVEIRRPDYVLVNGRRTLDIKTGYASGDIEVSQLKDYNDLINASRRRGNSELRQLLAGRGVQGGLTGHDYLFLPNAGDSAETAARLAFAKIERELDRQTANIRVYYLGDDGKIYQLVKGPTAQVESRLVGDRLPNQ